jgi:hypothetical protein
MTSKEASPAETGSFIRNRNLADAIQHLVAGHKAAGSRRRVLLWRAQFTLKPASKALGLHGVFIRGKSLKYSIADSAFKRVQVDAPCTCWLDADEHHLGLAPRTGRALNCSEWNDGRQALRLGHDASPRIGGSATLSVTGPRRRSGDRLSMRLPGSQTRVNSNRAGAGGGGVVKITARKGDTRLPPKDNGSCGSC